MEHIYFNKCEAVSDPGEWKAAKALLAHDGKRYYSKDPLRITQRFEIDSGNPVCRTQGTITDVETDQGIRRLLNEKRKQPLAVFNEEQKTMTAVAGTVVAIPKSNDGDIFYLEITKPHTPYPESHIVIVTRGIFETFYSKLSPR